MIVHNPDPITLIGGAKTLRVLVDQALTHAPTVVAADGGADQALDFNLMPEAVIGDFDSLSPEAKKAIPGNCLHHIAEQDSTDFEKCLRNVSTPLIIGVGFTGARLDHQLAACNALIRYPDRRCVLLGEKDLFCLAPPSLSLNLTQGTRVSLFPMGAVEGVSDGLRWPIAGLNFAPDRQIGTSNIATGPIHLTMTAPKMLLILPVFTLDILVEALKSTPSVWPAD